MALRFRYNNGTYSLPVTGGNTNVGAYGTLILRVENRNQKVLLAPYKDTNKTTVHTDGIRRYYYSANYPSIHCRKNNTNYSCCNNYQNFRMSVWRYDFTGGISDGMTTKTVNVSYAENSFLGSSYNKYTYQTKLAPYGMVTPTRSGYTFKGWNTSAEDTGDAYKSTSTYRSTARDATFYALWARIDEGTYSGSDIWSKLTSWFNNSYTTAKISNHVATLTIGSSTVSVEVGSVIQLKKTDSNFGFDHQYHIVIDRTAYEVYWTNWAGQSGGSMTISNGWLTDKYSPDIAAGTYSSSSFKNLISQFISVGGSRTVAKGFTAKVNGTSVTVPAGGTIYYMHPYSNPDTYLVGFGTKDKDNLYNIAQHSFSTDKTYCVYSSGGILSAYSNYSITLAQDIKFN